MEGGGSQYLLVWKGGSLSAQLGGSSPDAEKDTHFSDMKLNQWSI